MRILNKRTASREQLAKAVYIGRPSKWGNPFVIGKDGDRTDVIEKYEAWLFDRKDLMADLHELAGKDLVCWCAPDRCHGEVLREFSEAIWF